MTGNAVNITGEGLQVFSGTAFTAVDLTTKGDLLVKNASAYQRLASGSNDQALVAASGQASGLNWETVTPSGDRVLISTQTASNSATIDFTGLDDATYTGFIVEIFDAHPATDNVTFEMLFSTDNGSTFISSGYRWVIDKLDASAGTNTISSSSSDSTIDLATAVGNAAGEGAAGHVWVYPTSDPSNYVNNTVNYGIFSGDTTNDLNYVTGSGDNSTTSTVDAIRFKFSSGNIEVGTFRLYGLEDS